MDNEEIIKSNRQPEAFINKCKIHRQYHRDTQPEVFAKTFMKVHHSNLKMDLYFV